MNKFYLLFCAFFSIYSSAQEYAVSSIPQNLLTNANAVVREQSQDYILKSVNEMTITKSQVITILSAAGDPFATVYIPYNPTTKISNIKVEMFDETGKLSKTFSKKDFSDYTNNPSAGLYTDDRVLVLRPV